MSTPPALRTLSEGLHAELTQRILPYWMQHGPDPEHGGFVGLIDSRGRPDLTTEKGGVLNARILWTFAAAARLLENAQCKDLADRAYKVLSGSFWDEDEGGVFWRIAPDGCPTQPRKQVYAQAFALYAFAEYHRSTGHSGSRDRAVRLFELLEAHAHDDTHGGYVEARGRDWRPIEEVRLGPDDPNAPRSMNTALHVLEAFTTLYRVWPDDRVARRLDELIELFLERILDPQTHHLHCFFDEDWTPRSRLVSYGHDIEASWLLTEAAEVRGRADIKQRVESRVVRVAEAVRQEGLSDDGGIVYEAEGGRVVDADRHWWVQAEAMVGFVNAYQLSGADDFAAAARRVWEFVQEWVLDRTHGEWHARVSEEGVPYPSDPKVGPWKGPYHTVRACLEVVRRVHGLEGRGGDAPILVDAPREDSRRESPGSP